MWKDVLMLITFEAGEGDQKASNIFPDKVSNSLCNSDVKVKKVSF